MKRMKVGDMVRSYDFERARKCYIEGRLVGCVYFEGLKRYKILVERKIWAGKEVKNPLLCHVHPPVNYGDVEMVK